MSTVTTPLMTADEFLEWINRPANQEKRWELDEGKVVEMPSPGELHGVVCALIVRCLWEYVLRRSQGYVCANDSGLLVQRNPDTVRGPDVMLFTEARTMDQMSRKFTPNLPQLIVEVLSPTDRHSQLQKRIEQYHRRGVPLVWVVDPEDRTVTVYRPGEIQHVAEDQEELTGNGVLPDFRCRVADLFTLPGGQQT
jgi:Uma2 family endonuclease